MMVIIAGAGPAGSCLANGLRRHGIDLRVHERVERVERVGSQQLGYRINLDAGGRAALHDCLDDRARDALTTVLHHQRDPVATVRTTHGRLLGRYGVPGDPVAVDRTALRRVLVSGIADDIRWGSPVIDVGCPDRSDRAGVLLDDGSRGGADLVVGADGTWSAVRRALLPDERPRLAGTVAVYGRTPLRRAEHDGELTREALTSRVTTLVDEAGEVMVLGAWNPGPAAREVAPDLEPYLMWVLITSAAVPPRDDPAGLHAHVLDRVAGWVPELRRLVAAADPADTFPVELVTPGVVAAWPVGRVTLIGDAAHPMSPAGGQGANLALSDAARLTRALAGVGGPAGDLRAVLARHDRKLRDAAVAALSAAPAAGVAS